MHDQIKYLIEVLTERNTYALNSGFLYYSDEPVTIGQRVETTFNNKPLIGFVIKEVGETTETEEELKSRFGFKVLKINKIIDTVSIINKELFDTASIVSDRYFYPLIGALQTMFPKELSPKTTNNLTKINYEEYYVLHKELIPDKKLRNIDKILAEFEFFNEIPKSKLGKTKTLTELIECGAISIKKVEKYRNQLEKIYDYESEIILSKEQQEIVDGVLNSSKNVSLIHGVTGSGKTEIYIKIIERVLNDNKNVILLVPEIALTPLMVSRIISYFKKEDVALMHSSLSQAQKYDEYRRIKDGKVKIVIGTRSAIFAPLENIGLIIIDEEDSDSYKEENTNLIPYITKDVAIIRAKYYGAKVVLGSATPLIETMAKAKSGEYNLFTLVNRYNKAELPQIEIVDRTNFELFGYQSTIFSLPLIKEIQNRINKNEQTILFINNRGYSRSYYCRECGEVAKCPKCGLPLVYHKKDDTLRCHHCDYKIKKYNKCPSCGSKLLGFNGFGIEKVEEDFKKIFNVPYLVLDSDRTPKAAQISDILSRFDKKEALVLIGTQIVSKGHDFKDVTLVGVLNADQSLFLQNYRANEKTFSLITQTIGRAGRKDKKGLAIIQTSYKDNYVIKCAINNDYSNFYKYELNQRKILNNPPYYNILCIEVRAKNSDDLISVSKKIAAYYKVMKENIIVNSLSTVRELDKLFIGRVFIKYKKIEDIKIETIGLLNVYKNSSKVHLYIIPNPLGF